MPIFLLVSVLSQILGPRVQQKLKIVLVLFLRIVVESTNTASRIPGRYVSSHSEFPSANLRKRTNRSSEVNLRLILTAHTTWGSLSIQGSFNTNALQLIFAVGLLIFDLCINENLTETATKFNNFEYQYSTSNVSQFLNESN